MDGMGNQRTRCRAGPRRKNKTVPRREDRGTVSMKCKSMSLGWSAGLGAASPGGAVALGELVHASGGVHESLLASEERVAGGANAHAKVFHRGNRVINRAAGAGDRGFGSLGMEVFFHGLGFFVHRRGVIAFHRGEGAAKIVSHRERSTAFYVAFKGRKTGQAARRRTLGWRVAAPRTALVRFTPCHRSCGPAISAA